MEPEQTLRRLRKRVERAEQQEHQLRLKLVCLRSQTARHTATMAADLTDESYDSAILHHFRELSRHERLHMEAWIRMRNLFTHQLYMETLDAMRQPSGRMTQQ